MTMTLRQLLVFDAVASLGSVARAAEKLNMSQSAASAALKELQESLNRPALFHRVGRGLKITAEGERLQPRVRSLLREADELRDPTITTELNATITLGVADAGSYLLPPLAVAFRRHYPGVRINVVVGQSQEIVAQLSRFAVDLVITDSMARAPGSYLTEIYRERSVLIAAPDNPLAGLNDLSFAHLERADWCMPGRSTIANLTLNDAIRGHIANLRVAMEINSDEGVREAVKAGAGISCLPLSLVEGDLAGGKLVELTVPGFSAMRPTYLMRMQNVRVAPAVRAFEAHLLQSFAARAQAPPISAP